ncbi:hypothetical protein CI109_103768 [Kwoniella shandongensis]|uniref:Uncharacterized protein n=1 Tax=Kwoniella shandongensis TaxID=1734106 RepID=A0A5M6C7K5_9TREE|nr:uncharacterized protein CI109_000535 [Kwoniella shandongensis]KAA5530963.1 hypothetical protein CI109_000535 [Kwoniella shandongensis]
MLLSSLRIIILAPIYAAAVSSSSFHESLTLHPLPDGKLSVLFEFTTYFTSESSSSSSIAQSHHSLTPPSLLLPLEQNNVSELTVSFVAGRWDQSRSSESGPLHHESGGGGGEVRGWLREDEEMRKTSSERWNSVTHALGGLFCAGLGPSDEGENVRTFGEIYPPVIGDDTNLTHFLLSHPHHHLCTENLTPFLSLLPSKGLSGLSSLLAQPGIIFSWGFKTEGIEVIMPSSSQPQGRWKGWWEGVVDLVPERGTASREFSIETLSKKHVPRVFPEAESSVIRLIKPKVDSDRMEAEPAGRVEEKWVDGVKREVVEWDMLDETTQLSGKDIKVRWNDEGDFKYPRTFAKAPITISRTVVDSLASDGTFQIKITNNGAVSRDAVYSEIWPWWAKGWMSEIKVHIEGRKDDPTLLRDVEYHPSTPPKVSTTTLHFSLTLPQRSTIVLTIPFTKLTLKYTEHRPDAERGVELSSGVLTLLDLEQNQGSDDEARRSERKRIYTNRLLLDVPTPDFSMPYNVIIMSSTVMAVFFGLMQGGLTRRWGWVEVPKEDGTESGNGLTKDTMPVGINEKEALSDAI